MTRWLPVPTARPAWRIWNVWNARNVWSIRLRRGCRHVGQWAGRWLLGLAAVSLATSGWAEIEMQEETRDDAGFGPVKVFYASDEPKGVTLLISDADGWNSDLDNAARAIAKLDYVVAGVALDQYLARLRQASAACADPAADLDRLNRLIEQHYPLALHQPPVLLGRGAGAALGYVALTHGPEDRFHAGVAVDFCPRSPLPKPLCLGAGTVGPPEPTELPLRPTARLSTTWFIFQHRPACDQATTTTFLQAVSQARPTTIADAPNPQTWLPQVSALLQWLDPGIARQVQPDAKSSDLPLTEIPATGGPDRPQLAVMFSGDGGWAMLDRAVTAELGKNGLATVGWDSLSYFWKARQPEEVALDLEQTLNHYLEAWRKSRVVLIGYSFGADVLPAVINRLPETLRARIDLVALLGLSSHASFAFRLSNWISDAPDQGDQPVQPEMAKLTPLKRLCIYGQAETDDLCPALADLGVITAPMPGDHHFDEDYPGVAQRILAQLPVPTTGPSPPPSAAPTSTPASASTPAAPTSTPAAATPAMTPQSPAAPPAPTKP